MGMNIFENDAFSEVTLTDAIAEMDYQPSLLRDMGIFEKQPSRTTGIMLEKKSGTNRLVPVSQRGAPLTEAEKLKRNIRTVETHRLAIASTTYATEVQNIRAFGKETVLSQVQDIVAEGVAQSHGDIELTEENMMLGAVQGIVVDADGSTVLNNWFTFWDIPQPTEIAFDFANATVAELKANIKGVQRAIVDSAKGLAVREVIALCGDDFFDALIAHEAYTGNSINPLEAQRLVDEFGKAYSKVSLGEITWINYRGSESESEVSIATDKVSFFPIAKGLFKHGLGCAEFGEYINTLGRERYALTIRDRDRDAWVQTELYTYPLFYCTNPSVLKKGRAGA